MLYDKGKGGRNASMKTTKRPSIAKTCSPKCSKKHIKKYIKTLEFRKKRREYDKKYRLRKKLEKQNAQKKNIIKSDLKK